MTFPHTVGAGSDRYLKVGVAINQIGPATVSSITYAGVAMTRLGGSVLSGVIRVEYWYLLNPPTGTNDVVVTLSDSEMKPMNLACAASSYFGVNQTTPHGTESTATGVGTGPSVSVQSASGELVVDVMACADTGHVSVGSGQTLRGVADNGTTEAVCAVSDEAGATSVTMSHTIGAANDWAIIGVSLRPAAGGGAISGSSALAISGAGTLTGAGELAGTAGLAFAASAALKGAGELGGSGTLAFSTGAALKGAGALSGTTGLAFATSAALTGAGALAGSTASAFSASAALRGSGALSGAAALAFGASGSMAQGAISGSSQNIFSALGTLIGDGALSAAGGFAFVPTGTLSATVSISGSSALGFSVSGTLFDVATIHTPRSRMRVVHKVERHALIVKTDRSALVKRRGRLH